LYLANNIDVADETYLFFQITWDKVKFIPHII